MINRALQCVIALLLLVAALPVAVAATLAQPTSVGSMAVNSATNRHALYLPAVFNGLQEQPYVLAWIQRFSSQPSREDVAADRAGSAYLIDELQENVIIRKYDQDGNVLWTKQPAPAVGSAFSLDNAGNLYLVGSVGAMGSVGNESLVRKFDPDGNELWERRVGAVGQYGPTNWSLGGGLDAAGNVYLVGFVGDQIGQVTSSFIQKYDPSGVEQWSRLFANTEGSTVAVDGIGNVYVGGVLSGDSFVRKHDPAGNEIWTQRFNVRGSISGFEGVNSLGTDAAGDVFAVGVASGSPFSEPRSGAWEAFVRKLDPNGKEAWTHRFQLVGGTVANGVKVDEIGNVFVVGTAGYPGHQSPSLDVFLRKYDINGNELWTQEVGGPEADRGTGIALGGPGVVYIAGVTAITQPEWGPSYGGLIAKFVSVAPTLAPPTPIPSPTPPPAGSTWFFAEGSSQPPFDTWFLIENPSSQPANVNVTFFLQPSGTVSQRFVVSPTSRFSLFANEAIPNQAFSTRIDADQQIYAERAMYVSYDGDVVTGIPGTNKTWLFAEGATVQPFQTWLLLQNPNTVPAPTTITYLLESGQTVTQQLILPSNSRTSIFVNDVLPDAAFSSRVDSDQPIIAERAMYRFPGNAATAGSGVNAPATAWYFSEGRTYFRDLNADTFLLLQNPNTTQTSATVTLYGTDGRTVTFPVVLAPTSRRTIYLNPFFDGSFGIKVTADKPIIAERSIFFGNEPMGSYSTKGAMALSTSWHLAEGETRDPFDELVTVLNPQGQTMGVHIDFELENGQVIGRDFTVGANSKLEVQVNDILTGANSATITTSLPSVVERTMFIFKFGSIGATDTVGISQAAVICGNIVTNGDFEVPNAGSSYVTYSIGQSFGGWTVDSGHVDFIGGYWQAASGHQSVDLTLYPGPGALYQDLATTPDKTYLLTFAMAGNPKSWGPTGKEMEVWWGTTRVDTVSFDTSGHTLDSMGWQYHSDYVKASATVTRLRFKNVTELVWGSALDAVSVCQLN